jgi:hypothetical protein
MSSMLSAPEPIPATSAGSFTAALAAAGPATVSVSATSRCSPHRSANASTGASPAHEIRFGSSNTAETS